MKRRPVVCIHGAMRSSVGMWPTALWLRRQGFDAVPFGYSTRRGRLTDHARALAEFVERRFGPSPEVLGFFTHSMGGLVVRTFLGTQPPERVGARQRIVMLSPPNQGSALARANAGNPLFRWVYGRASVDLVRPLDREVPALPASARLLILAGGTGGRGYNPLIPGDDDGLVGLSEMRLGDIEPTFVGGPHSTLQWSPRILARAAAFLREDSIEDLARKRAPSG